MNTFINRHVKNILDYLKIQKEAGVILLPPYLDAQIAPDDNDIMKESGMKIKIIDENVKENDSNEQNF